MPPAGADDGFMELSDLQCRAAFYDAVGLGWPGVKLDIRAQIMTRLTGTRSFANPLRRRSPQEAGKSVHLPMCWPTPTSGSGWVVRRC
jgi:hypothetical protein